MDPLSPSTVGPIVTAAGGDPLAAAPAPRPVRPAAVRPAAAVVAAAAVLAATPTLSLADAGDDLDGTAEQTDADAGLADVADRVDRLVADAEARGKTLAYEAFFNDDAAAKVAVRALKARLVFLRELRGRLAAELRGGAAGEVRAAA